MALFSLTIPLMRLAVHEVDPTILGVGRILLAAVPAVIVLGFIGVPRLSWGQFGRLCLVTGCLVFGFAWLVATALRTVPSHHAAIVTGGIPLFTAIAARPELSCTPRSSKPAKSQSIFAASSSRYTIGPRTGSRSRVRVGDAWKIVTTAAIRSSAGAVSMIITPALQNLLTAGGSWEFCSPAAG